MIPPSPTILWNVTICDHRKHSNRGAIYMQKYASPESHLLISNGEGPGAKRAKPKTLEALESP